MRGTWLVSVLLVLGLAKTGLCAAPFVGPDRSAASAVRPEPAKESEASKAADLVLVRVQSVGQSDGKGVLAQLTYWRREGNVFVADLPAEGKTLRLIGDQKYTFRAEPRIARAAAVTVGPLDPLELKEKGLTIPITSQQPLLTYHWRVPEEDRPLLKEDSIFYLRVIRIDDKGQRHVVDDPEIPHEFPIRNRDTGEREMAPKPRSIYGLIDGSYEFSAVIARGSAGTDPLATGQPVHVVVQEGKAVPADITLVISSRNTGTLNMQVAVKEGEPMRKGFIHVVREGTVVARHPLGEEGGTWSLRLPCGSYQVEVLSPDGRRRTAQAVEVKPGVNPLTLALKPVVSIKVRCVGPDGQPVAIEGRWFPRLVADEVQELSRPKKFGDPFEIEAMQGDFPILICAVAIRLDSENHRPEEPSLGWAGMLLEKPPTEAVVLSFPNRPLRSFRVEFPKAWPADNDGSAYLWFTAPGTIVPSCELKLRPMANNMPAAAPDTERMVLEGKANLAEGSHEILVQLGSGSKTTFFWLGSVTVKGRDAVTLKLFDKDAKAKGTLAAIREAMRKPDTTK